MVQPEHPNGYTPVDNDWLESAAKSKLFPQKVRVLFVVMRKTWGWEEDKKTKKRKVWDDIAFSQFEEYTGMSERATKRAVAEAVADKLIDKRGGDNPVSDRSVTRVKTWRTTECRA